MKYAKPVVNNKARANVRWGQKPIDPNILRTVGGIGIGIATLVGTVACVASVVCGVAAAVAIGALGATLSYATTTAGTPSYSASGALASAAFGGLSAGIPGAGAFVAKSAPIAAESISAAGVAFSQSSVNGAAVVRSSMTSSGWVGDAVDLVRMPGGGLTALDNTRLLAAKQSGTTLQANVHAFSDPLPAAQAIRFTTERSGIPTTWGEAIQFRVANQNSTFRSTYPNGSPFTGSR